MQNGKNRPDIPLPSAAVVLNAFNTVFSKPNENDPKINSILLWYVTEVLPHIHVSS